MSARRLESVCMLLALGYPEDNEDNEDNEEDEDDILLRPVKLDKGLLTT